MTQADQEVEIVEMSEEIPVLQSANNDLFTAEGPRQSEVNPGSGTR